MFPTPEPVDAQVIYHPLYTQLMSLLSLGDHEKVSGLSDWSVETASQMGEALRGRHQSLFRWIGMDSLVNVAPNQTREMPAFISALSALTPTSLRDQLFAHMLNSTHIAVSSDYWQIPVENPAELLANVTLFTAHFGEVARRKIKSSHIQAAHTLLNDPDQLKSTLISHLQTIWERYLADEWLRVEPKVLRSVQAFQAIPWQNPTILEAIQIVTGRDLRPAFRLEKLFTFRQIRFVPHVHNGPYIMWFGRGAIFYIGFPAREPTVISPQFDATTFVNRCKALADDTRLAILLALAERDTLSTAQIIEHFQLDKSAASRHLRQLVATSLLHVQQVDRAKKVYSLNRAAFAELLTNLQELS